MSSDQGSASRRPLNNVRLEWVTTVSSDTAFVMVAQLASGLAARDVIGQAKGILMAQRRIGPDEAFSELRGASQTTGRKVIEVAQTIVDDLLATFG